MESRDPAAATTAAAAAECRHTEPAQYIGATRNPATLFQNTQD